MEEKKNHFRDMSEFENSEDYETFGKRWLKKSKKLTPIHSRSAIRVLPNHS